MRPILITLLTLTVIQLNAQHTEQPRDVVFDMFRATDEKNWTALENTFANTVTLDYSSMTGYPEANLNPNQIVASWKKNLQGFSATHHQITNIQETINDKIATLFAYGTATHYLEHKSGSVWTVVGTYNFELVKQNNAWKIDKMVFHYKYQDGNTELLYHAKTKLNKRNMKKVTFKSDGLTLVGDLYYPLNYEEDKKYPALIVSGSWTTVKEQMARLYAKKLAEQGFMTLAFDFRNFGESEGEPRYFESPELKKEDIKNAVSFLESLDSVDASKIGGFGVCAGAMYTLMASAEDTRIKSVVTTASWLHDAEAVKLFYGGEDGVQAKIEAAKKAKQKYAETGEVAYIPAISETDETAAMYGPYDYYLNPERGAITQWRNDKFAVASWEDWLTANPMPVAKQLNIPVLMIHSDGAVLPNYTKTFFSNIASEDKKLHWMDTELESPFHQFNFYDQDEEVNAAVEEASKWFEEKL